MARYKGKHRRGWYLRNVGWGLFPTPGEERRLKKAEKEALEIEAILDRLDEVSTT
jgi:hypothetical protein